ncbi:Methyltransferase type 11 [Sideroxydans lithotrophicus ES-1]|uniref:Methyltransferase type 11 n=2 Tax=Sideroxydans TaxID=314343 RepID=D5CR06_SIDLE|nr:Methyltransferase type 11 [Sideroxydans lithotrophicus ES-1]
MEFENMPLATAMKISEPGYDRVCDERDIYERLLPLEDADILELGCGKAEKTFAIAERGKANRIVALEVDEIQHAKNLQRKTPSNVSFQLGGAQAIPVGDRSFDIVLMFKSLHHVPLALMDTAMAEIHRVLKPGGMAYISEPVFAGEFNEILRLFHDEQAVRAAAFAAVERAVAAGSFELASETFFDTPVHFENFEQFEEQILKVTHTQHRLAPELYQQVRQKFMHHMKTDGASFRTPIRVDLLRKV